MNSRKKELEELDWVREEETRNRREEWNDQACTRR